MAQKSLNWTKQHCSNRHCDMYKVEFHNDYLMEKCPFCGKKTIKQGK
jgi:hypothetical protein